MTDWKHACAHGVPMDDDCPHCERASIPERNLREVRGKDALWISEVPYKLRKARAEGMEEAAKILDKEAEKERERAELDKAEGNDDIRLYTMRLAVFDRIQKLAAAIRAAIERKP